MCQGPSHWSEVSSACGGSQQSPIDISSDTVFDPSIAELKLGTYDTPTGEDSGVLTTIKNSGHSGMYKLMFVTIYQGQG